MIFTTWLYGFFLFGAVTGFWLLPIRWRTWWLLATGVAFYAHYYPPHLPLVIGLTTLVYVLARTAELLAVASGRRLLALGIAAAIGVLGYYKYAGLALETLGWSEASAAQLVPTPVPLAISFFVFEYVHYLIEIRRGTIPPGRPRDFLLFILFFPTLISGPIKRFADFQSQIGRVTRPDPAAINRGIERILVGLAKKLVIADTVQRLLAPLFLLPLAQTPGMLWLGAYGYALQIFFDFSGYSDIAIGSALLLGFHVPENFDRPYLQPNLTRFWRSWHMSLTSWITDYVYIPLGGNRHGPWRAGLNRLAAMTLCGLWHGAAGHFLLWGAYHGLGLNLHQGWRALRPRLGLPADFGTPGRIAATILTFHFVSLGWMLFVLDAAIARVVIARMLGLG